MNRDRFKFRAWDKQTNNLVYFGFTELQQNLFSIRELAGRNGWTNPVEQWTGIWDKNGKLIYEGDLLHRYEIANFREIEYTAPVVWDEGFFTTDETGSMDAVMQWEEGMQPLLEYEAVGNVHEK